MREGIYVASKTRHAEMWKGLRQAGAPIIATWIDEAGAGESADLSDLWRRCIAEASGAAALVIYREPDDALKGGWIELGAALASGVPVFAVGLEGFTIAHDKRITHCQSVDEAMSLAANAQPRAVGQGHAAIERLIALARAAWTLLDNTANEDPPEVEQADWDNLAAAMNELDKLPDDRPGFTLDGPGRAEWALERAGVLAPTEPTCRHCGCTWNDACHDHLRGSCCWAEDDLCSHCDDTLQAVGHIVEHASEADTVAISTIHLEQLLKMAQWPATDPMERG